MRLPHLDTRTLAQRARDTRQCEICSDSCAASDAGMDVIDMKRRFLRPLWKPAVFADVASPRADKSSKSGGNVLAHVASFATDRCARAFMSDNMSTSSVKAVASRR